MEYEYFFILATHQENTDVVNFINSLKDDPIEWERIRYHRESIFLKACEHGKLDVMVWLLTMEPFTFLFSMDEELFVTAVKGNHLPICQWIYFLSHELDLRGDDDLYYRLSCEHNSLRVKEWLLSKHPEILDTQYHHTFHYGCKYNHFQLIQTLLLRYPHLQVTYDDLYQSCMEGHLEIAQYIYPYVTDLSSSLVNTLFTHVCVQDQFEIAKWLLYMEPCIDLVANEQVVYICSAFDLSFFTLLYDRHDHIPPEVQKEMFVQLSVNGKLQEFEYFLKFFQDEQLEFDQELLQHACQGGNTTIVSLILSYNPSLQPTEKMFMTISQQGNIELFQRFEQQCPYHILQRCYLEGIDCKQMTFCKYLYSLCGHELVSKEQLQHAVLSSLISNHHLSFLEWILTTTSLSIEVLFEKACITGQMKILRYLYTLLSLPFENDSLFREVCRNNQYEVCLFLCQLNEKYSYDISEEWELQPIIRETVKHYYLHCLSNELCCVCYEEGTVMTDCNHYYCVSCLSKTLAMYQYSNKCGMCRSKVKVTFGKNKNV